MVEHKLNQCANDWIMCRCGKLFADKNDDGSAKDKFLDHLQDEDVGVGLVLYYQDTINKKSHKTNKSSNPNKPKEENNGRKI